jgi:flagellar biosynthetic protein FliQ
MDVPAALDLGREALLTTLVVAAPVLAAGIVVGLVISLLQALTQLHDQTLTIVPKIIAMLVAAFFFAPWLAYHVLEYTRAMFGHL